MGASFKWACFSSGSAAARRFAIPVFPHRKFCHGNVLVHSASGIQKAEDLAGKTIGMRAHFNPVSLWMCGILEEKYGVPARSLRIRTNQEEQVPGWRVPDWMEIKRLPEGKKIEDVFPSGELDACMLPEITPQHLRIPGVRRLWPNYREVERQYYLDTQIFPIRHAVVVKNSILESHPWVARSLTEAFTIAKEKGIKHVNDTRRSLIPAKDIPELNDATVRLQPNKSWTRQFRSNVSQRTRIIHRNCRSKFYNDQMSFFASSKVITVPGLKLTFLIATLHDRDQPGSDADFALHPYSSPMELHKLLGQG